MKYLVATLLCLKVSLSFSQIFFPLTENAANIPGNVLVARMFTKTYQEVDTRRNLFGLRLMYGVTPRLTIIGTYSLSNHHNHILPNDFIVHKHVGNQVINYAQSFKRGVPYPYSFPGLHLYGKYRFFSMDEKNKFFRMAMYGEWSNVKQAHDEAEPNLVDDTAGYGGGLIFTYLNKRLGISLNTGFIIPKKYTEWTTDVYGGPDLFTSLYYGKAVTCNLSLGYLFAPKNITNYKQANWNAYLEFLGKKYTGSKAYRDGQNLPIQTELLESGYYVEVHPGIQKFIRSNLRIDLSVGINLIQRSYVWFYPVWNVGVQRYFFFHKGRG